MNHSPKKISLLLATLLPMVLLSLGLGLAGPANRLDPATAWAGPATVSTVVTGTPAFGRLFPYNPDGKLYGYVNILGEFVVEPQFSRADHFSEGRAVVSIDGETFGYLDQTGQMAVEPQFSYAGPFSTGLAVVNLARPGSNEAEMAYIDRAGQVMFDGAVFQMAADFSEGLAAVRVDDQWGYLDYGGKLAIEPQFELAGAFAEGLAPVNIEGQYGYIDPGGQVVIEPQFEFANPFSGGRAYVSVAGLYGYINHQGEIVIEPQFEFAANFSEGLALVRQEGREIYIDAAGRTVIDDADLNFGNNFSEGLAGVILGGVLGFINHQGEPVIPPQFIPPRYIAEAIFKDGLAQVQTENSWGYIDPNGRWLLELPAPPLSEALLGGQPLDGDATRVVDFIPAVPEETAPGACFSQSLNLSYAWRCSAGGQVYEPCLIAADGETLVCGANPASGAAGLAIELSQPLPEADVDADQSPDIWLFELANGEICGPATGATLSLDGKPNTYLCSGGSMLFGAVDSSGDVWQIERLSLGRDDDGNLAAEEAELVNIVTAWRPADATAE
jgi:hypothetical protein